MMPPFPPVVLPPAPGYGGDTIQGYELASIARFNEGSALLAGHPLGAIYLLGYVAEMTIKAAWFRALGHGAAQVITDQDWRSARALAGGGGLNLGNLHNVAAWARFMIATKAQMVAYPPAFAAQLEAQADIVHQWWAVEMRYHTPVLPPGAAPAVQAAVQWIQANYPQM